MVPTHEGSQLTAVLSYERLRSLRHGISCCILGLRCGYILRSRRSEVAWYRNARKNLPRRGSHCRAGAHACAYRLIRRRLGHGKALAEKIQPLAEGRRADSVYAFIDQIKIRVHAFMHRPKTIIDLYVPEGFLASSPQMSSQKRTSGGKRSKSRSPGRSKDENGLLKRGRSPSPNRSRRPIADPPRRNGLVYGVASPQACIYVDGFNI